MLKFGISIRLEAKPSKETELSEFLKSALPLAENEPGTINWYAVQLSNNTFGVFDTFESEEARHEHHTGLIAQALMKKAPELLVKAPVIELFDVIAAK